jgi:phytoene/squalene synthetase
MIEDDIKKDFANALIGIKLLDIEARSAVYIAYRYYISLFKKIQRLDATDILKKRIRISNLKKFIILIISQIKIRFF